MIDLVIEKITEQQTGKENTPAWMVGEQLKDICRKEPENAEIVLKDLDVTEMSIEAAEGKIKKWADEHKTGNCCCVPPNVAEKIIREFYGLGSPASDKQEDNAPGILNLADFL